MARFLRQEAAPQGRVHRLADYRGRWVLVNVWATWCTPCLEEIPELVALAESRGDIQIIGMAIEWQDRDQVLQFAEGMFVNYPIVLGRREDAQAIGKVSGLPTSFIFDVEGRLAARYTGALKEVVAAPFVPVGYESAWALYTIRVKDRDGVRARLDAKGIGTGLFYRLALHQHPAFKGYDGRPLPVSEISGCRCKPELGVLALAGESA